MPGSRLNLDCQNSLVVSTLQQHGQLGHTRWLILLGDTVLQERPPEKLRRRKAHTWLHASVTRSTSPRLSRVYECNPFSNIRNQNSGTPLAALHTATSPVGWLRTSRQVHPKPGSRKRILLCVRRCTFRCQILQPVQHASQKNFDSDHLKSITDCLTKQRRAMHLT